MRHATDTEYLDFPIFVFTALASEERRNVIARVCMSVRMSVSVTKMCNEYKFALSMRDDGFSISQCHILLNIMLFALYLTLPWFAMIAICCIVTSDISRGDELKPKHQTW
jgi:hypothetical protein